MVGMQSVPRRMKAGEEMSHAEGIAYAAVGEGGGVGLLLHQQLAGELLHHPSLAVEVDEGIVLLGGRLGKGLEPVGVVSGAVVDCPALHAVGYGVGDVARQRLAVVDGVREGAVGLQRQVLVHRLAIEYQRGVIVAGAPGGHLGGYRLTVGGRFHGPESQCVHFFFCITCRT